MSAKGEFQGQLIINDVVVSHTISAYISDGSASFRDAGLGLSRIRISLTPFDEFLLLGVGAEKASASSTYRYEWSNSGGLSRAVGHPADGEPSDYQKIKVASLTLRFHADRINVSISGDASSENLGTSSFQINFVIKKNQMYSFFSTWNHEIDQRFEAALCDK